MRTYFIKTEKDVLPISQLPLFFFIFCMAFCPLWGQHVPKKPTVQPKDYAMWHTLRYPQISGDGQWTSYQLGYEQQQDSLLVLNIKNKTKYDLPGAYYGQFEPSTTPSLFACITHTEGIGVLHLNTGETEWIPEADRFEFSMDGTYLACNSTQSPTGYLKLWDIQKNKTTEITGVQHFSFSPKGNTAVLITKDSLETQIELLQLDTMRRTVILSSGDTQFVFPTWNKKGDGMAFMERNEDLKQRLYYFEFGETPLLEELGDIDLKDGREISNINPTFSKDGERIFFWTQLPEQNLNETDKDSVKVQLWKGTDKWIYPRQQLDWEYNKKDLQAVWWPKTKKVFQVGTPELPEVMLTGNQKYALTYNLLTYEPQNRHMVESDFYITNLDTGITTLLTKKMEASSSVWEMSPNGDYVAYFKDKNWWIYTILKNTHTNATAGISVPLHYKHAPHSVDDTPYGVMGWTTEGELLIYDEFDIWKISAQGKAERLTKGRETHTYYRAYDYLYDGFYPFWVQDSDSGHNLKEDTFLMTRDSLFNYGYMIRKPNGTLETFLMEAGKITGLRKAKFAETYLFVKEKNTEPPAMYLREAGNIKKMVQSNPQQKKFSLGKTELITYHNKQGEKLNGLLHYPDNYQEGKQYPMVVHVYELLSRQFQTYTNPGYYNDDGFNYRNLTASGYFVLEPDILIQKGNPGIAAADCVITAVDTVLEKGIVDKGAIGLVGHSFGGYETAFIITQTNLFAAAVVGAGVFDIVSSYHTIRKTTGQPHHFLYENQQWQIGKSFYEDKQGYYNNSPMTYAQHIKTPTLIWTGNEDYHVNWHQSEAMYLALRRLNMEVEMLVYENEIHALMQPKNQKDLTQRIQNWLDTYLKPKKE